MKPSDSDNTTEQAKSPSEPPIDTIEGTARKVVSYVAMCLTEPKRPNGVKNREVIIKETINILSTLITQARHNCNATPDDQPNDHHIQYFNQGYKKGRKDTLTEVTIWASQEMANDHVKESE